MSAPQVRQVRQRRSRRINPAKTGRQNWDTARTRMGVITGNKPDRDKNPSGLRIREADGSIKKDQKVNRFLQNFGDLGDYLDEQNSHYKGWTGMRPIYEMNELIDGIDYREIFLNKGEDLIFSEWDYVKKNGQAESFIDELGRQTSKRTSEGLRISVKSNEEEYTTGGLRLRQDLMDASLRDPYGYEKPPLIFVFATHAHVMLAIVHEGKIYSIGYAHVVEDNHIARGKIQAGIDANRLPDIVDAHTFEVMQGVLWSCDYVMPGINHPVKVPWVDYFDNDMALRLDDYLSKVSHIEIEKQMIKGREKVSNQTQLFIDRALYLKSAAQLSPVFKNKDKAMNCILWAGYIVGKDFSCGLLNDPKDCKSITDRMMMNLYEGQEREGNYYVGFNNQELIKAHNYLEPTMPHQLYNSMMRNPKTAAAVCGAGTAALCPGATGTVAAAAAKGAIAGTAIGACCQYTTGAVMGNMSTSNKSQDHAPQVLEMNRRGGKTRKRKYRKRNRLKTKKRNRKKTNKRKKRKTKSKRKFKKKTRKSK